MRKIDLLVIHCSATRPKSDIGAAEIDKMHKANGWNRIGYHYVIRRNGAIEAGRPEAHIGAHTKGHNANSIGICLVGGLNEEGQPEDNFTDAQYLTLRFMVQALAAKYDLSYRQVAGHRDLSPDLDGDGVIESHEWVKLCPCFSVTTWIEDNDVLTT